MSEFPIFFLGFSVCIALTAGLLAAYYYFSDKKEQTRLSGENEKLHNITVESIRKRIAAAPLEQLVSDDNGRSSSSGDDSPPKR